MFSLVRDTGDWSSTNLNQRISMRGKYKMWKQAWPPFSYSPFTQIMNRPPLQLGTAPLAGWVEFRLSVVPLTDQAPMCTLHTAQPEQQVGQPNLIQAEPGEPLGHCSFSFWHSFVELKAVLDMWMKGRNCLESRWLGLPWWPAATTTYSLLHTSARSAHVSKDCAQQN